MSKINLLTIHWGESFGAVLQTYATLRLLKEQGHEVTIINLVDYKFTARYKMIGTYRYIFSIIGFKFFKLKHLKSMTPLMYSIEMSKIPPADYTVVGSDQVWNRDITRDLALSYFLPFAKDTKRISLASSFSKKEWGEDEAYTDSVRSELKEFKAISVREQSGVRICEETLGLKAKCVIDPTIAWGNYRDLIGEITPDRSLCCFRFIDSDLFNKCISLVSSKKGIPVKYLRHFTKKDSGSHISCNSPIRWLKEIAKSEFVITDSFHGIVFSILFHKPFIALQAIPNRFERIESLLAMLGLSERIVESESDLIGREEILLSPIDYNRVDPIIECKRQEYLDFLNSNIS